MCFVHFPLDTRTKKILQEMSQMRASTSSQSSTSPNDPPPQSQPHTATRRDQTPSTTGSQASTTVVKPQTKPRLKKRVYVVIVVLVGLFMLAVANEGMGGIVTVAVALVLLRALWWVLSVLVLNRFPFFNTMCNVLFQFTAADAKPPPKKTHIKFV